MLDIKTLEPWLWDAACSIRGAVDAPKFKDYILPLIFVKRISDVFEDELGGKGTQPFNLNRERQFKKWNIAWEIALIEKNNPEWLDL